VCPFCGCAVAATTLAVDEPAWLEHLGTHGEEGVLVARRFRAAATAVNVGAGAGAEPAPATQAAARAAVAAAAARVDAAPVNEAPDAFCKGVLPLCSRFDWRALLLHVLLERGLLLPTSVLCQEIVVLGLFFFGLVNQRSPQKFGQYPQLQAFQTQLHRASPTAYKLYCGGIKDGALGQLHIRGKPVPVTTAVLQAYHHYGLSSKSMHRIAKQDH
jgi:hypothetical protein